MLLYMYNVVLAVSVAIYGIDVTDAIVYELLLKSSLNI